MSDFLRTFFLSAFLLLATLACEVRQDDHLVTEQGISEPSASLLDVETPPVEPRVGEVLESYSESRRIGRPGRNKIEIDVVCNGPPHPFRSTNLAVIRFYALGPSRKWKLKQTLQLEDYAITEADPQYVDFNNDGFKDVTFVSGTAARGANELRTLLIYDKLNDALLHVENSAEYPNLRYNRTLNCIDAWLFHGTTTTVFLRLDGNMLREFASVNTGMDRVVTLIGKDGKEREIRREKMKEEDIYTRYRTFNPPRP